MADALPRVQESNPIIQAPAIESRAAGDDALAAGFGKLSDAASTITQETLKAKSNSQYLSTLSNLEKIKTDALVNTIRDPSNAASYARTATQTMDVVTKGAQINAADKEKLNFQNTQNQNQLAIKSAETQQKQAQIGQLYSYIESEPEQQKVLEQSLQDTSPAGVARSKALMDARHKEISNMVFSGAMTPIQAGNALEIMHVGVDKASNTAEYIKQINSGGDVDSRHYQANNSNPLTPQTPGSLAGTPSSANTQTLATYHDDDLSIGSIREHIMKGEIPDPSMLMNLKNPAMQREVMNYVRGAQRAYGDINSNQNVTYLKSRYASLSHNNQWLSQEDQVYKGLLKKNIDMLEHGNSRDFLDNTAIGQTINDQETQTMASIQNNGAMDDSAKYVAARNAFNSFMNKRVSTLQAQHVPNSQINVAPEVTAQLENTFKSGDVGTAMQTLSTLHDHNQMLAIEAIKNPTQRAIMQTVTMGNQNNRAYNADYEQLIRANVNTPLHDGKGQAVSADKFSILYPSDKRPNANAREQAISVSVNDALKQQKLLIQKQYPPDVARQMSEGMQMGFVNYIKQQAVDNNDSAMNHINDYVAKAKTLAANSYDLQAGVNWTVNGSQVKNNRIQLDWMAEYGIDKAMHFMADNSGGKFTYDQIKNKNFTNKMTMTITPSNELRVVDSYGRNVYTEPMTGEMWTQAKKFKEERTGKKL